MSKYLIVIERAKRNYSAYCPDLPGCVATGRTKREAAKNIRDAIALHLEELKKERLPIPPHSATAGYVAI